MGKVRLIATKLWGRSFTNLMNEKRKLLQTFKRLRKDDVVCSPITNMVRQSGTTTIKIKEYQSSRKYTGLWKLERLAGVSLIFLIPSAFYYESKELEMIMGFIATLHTYWGCESMCKDYVRSSVVGKFLPVMARFSNISISVATLVGIHNLIYKDCGIVKLFKQLWAIRGHKDQKRK
ncbi:succinate dehydrogenase [ubiquinone] cytochrome b small subunit, mitochondrial-like [Haematobia irritans]|uniref:succinate dehydrogenase [ubiquinone] cytochrome b small subunit, mitochondrial-like n=1 Tax=Haematobia irritans TaxID=7368 RepID=UPI003F5046E4